MCNINNMIYQADMKYAIEIYVRDIIM